MKTLFLLLCLFVFVHSFAQNKGIFFDKAQKNYIEVPHVALLYPVNNFTIEYSIKIDEHSDQSYSIITKAQCVTQKTTFTIGFLADHSVTFSYNCNGNCAYTIVYICSTVLNLGQCYHVAVTYSSAGPKIYLNGVLQPGTYQTSTTGYCGDLYLSPEPMRIGAYRFQADTIGGFLEGMFDELRIWNHVRTETQIATMYEQELTGNETGLLLYYKFSDPITGTGSTVVNSASFSGTQLNGTTHSLNSSTPYTGNSCFNYSSINELSTENNTFIIYPNPTNNYFNIESVQNISNYFCNISILDITGREVFNNQTTLPAQIDLSGFEKGIYYVKITDENSSSSSKISLF